MKNNLQPLVSVIIPTYNGEKRIAKTLNSIIEQDYENLEIIVVDDVSTDNTVEIVKNILEKSKRNFHIIQRTVNGRQAAARNTGFNASNGKYVIFFDHDDLAEKNFVSSLCSEAENKNSDFVFCGVKHFYEAKKTFEHENIIEGNNNFISPEDYLTAWAEQKIFFWSVWNFIFKKDFLIKNKIRFFESCYLGDDTEFVLKALGSALKISFVKDTFYIYIHHMERSSIKFKSLEKRLEMFDYIFLSRLRIARFLRNHTKSFEVKKYILNFYIPDAFITKISMCIDDKNRNYYDRLIKTLRHKKIREILLSASKFIFKKPELFFKSLMLLYAPNFYYSIRKKKEARNED